MRTSRTKPVMTFTSALFAAWMALRLSNSFVGCNLFSRGLPLVGMRSTNLESPEKKVRRSDEFFKGSNFMKVLVQMGDLDLADVKNGFNSLAVGSTKFLISPPGQYFGFGHIGDKVLLISGEEPDILAVITKLFPPNEKGNVALRLLIPKMPNSPFFKEDGQHLQNIRETLVKLDLETRLPINEVLVELVGEPLKVYEAVKWFINVANGEEAKVETRWRLKSSHQDLNRSMGKPTEIMIPVPVEQSGRIIGKGGEGIKKLASRMRVAVFVQPKSEAKDGKVMVTLRGPIGTVHEAHLEINRILSLEKELVTSEP